MLTRIYLVSICVRVKLGIIYDLCIYGKLICMHHGQILHSHVNTNTGKLTFRDFTWNVFLWALTHYAYISEWWQKLNSQSLSAHLKTNIPFSVHELNSSWCLMVLHMQEQHIELPLTLIGVQGIQRKQSTGDELCCVRSKSGFLLFVLPLFC